MAQCKWCNKDSAGLSNNGLCKGCDFKIVRNIQGRVKQMKKASDNMNNPPPPGCIIKGKPDMVAHEAFLFTYRLRQLNAIIDHAKALAFYAAKGIPTITPPPAELIEKYFLKREEEILTKGIPVFENKIRKFEKDIPNHGSLWELLRLLDEMRGYTAQVNDSSKLQSLMIDAAHKFSTIFKEYFSRGPEKESKEPGKVLVECIDEDGEVS